MRTVSVLLALLAVPTAPAQDPPISRQPIHVVAMSVDPSLLEHNGASVQSLKAYAEQQLRESGIPMLEHAGLNPPGPRVAFAFIPRTAGEQVVAVIEFQYQQPARLVESPESASYATTWRRWWATTCAPSALATELRRGIETCRVASRPNIGALALSNRGLTRRCSGLVVSRCAPSSSPLSLISLAGLMKYDDASYHSGKGATDGHSFAHIGLWFRWCLSAGLVSDEHTEEPELKRALIRVQSGRLTGAEYLLQHTSGKLADTDLTEEGNRFTKHAYPRSYLSELRALTGKPDYAVTEAEVDFAALKQRLDAVFAAWKAGASQRPWWRFWGS